jgi:eukaryotic-like serine/threonine-protein kinase
VNDPLSQPRSSDERDLPEGTTFGKYTLKRVLGRGGMGTIYEAIHETLHKRVALKTLARAMSTQGDTAERFVREAKTAARLHHPHVVDITDVGIEDGIPYMVMEYLEGEDLAAVYERECPLPVSRAVDVLLPVIAAVSSAHAEGIVHRDLKPHNVFLARTKDGIIHPKLLDFGISKVLEDAGGALTNSSTFLGTPGYMAPEQVTASKAADARADQYALAVILYQGLTGRLPFEQGPLYQLLHAIVNDPFPSPRELRPELPEDLEAVILHAMRRSREDRFPSVRDLGAALLPFAGASQRSVWEPVFGPPGPISLGTPSGSRMSKPSDTVANASTLAASTDTGRVSGASSVTVPGQRKRRRSLSWAVGGIAVAAVAGAVWVSAMRTPPTTLASASSPPVVAPTSASMHVAVDVIPASASILVDGAVVGTGTASLEVPTGRDHVLRATADGYLPVEIRFRESAPPGRVTLEPVALGKEVAPVVSPLPVGISKAPPAAAPKAPATKPEKPSAPPPTKAPAGANGARIIAD